MSEKRTDGKRRGQKLSERKIYKSPKLVRYGDVRALTRSGTGTKNEGSPGVKRVGGSDRRMKEGIVRVGMHPLGIGLYLFRYRPEFQARWGAGRQFGVMADEVETVLPEAVETGPDGYRTVDYAKLEITRFAA